jgi:FixJ family two-component response regulator
MKTPLDTDDIRCIDGYGLAALRGPGLVRAAPPEGFEAYLLDPDEAHGRSIRRVCADAGWPVHRFVDVDAMIAFASRRGPACVMLDLDWPGNDALAVQRVVHDRLPHVATLFVARRADVRACVEAMRQGAVDFLEKPVEEGALRHAMALAAAASRTRWARRVSRERELERLSLLTPRERQVLALVIAGRRNKEIAYALACEESTVKVHRSRLMRKLGTRSLADLLSFTRELQPAAAPELPAGATLAVV